MESSNKWVTLGKALVRTLEQLPNLSAPAVRKMGELANAADETTAIKILIELANTERRFFDQILPIFKKNMKNADEINNEMDDLVEKVKTQLDNGATEDEVIKTIDDGLDADYITWQSQEIKQLFRQDILDEISSYKPKKVDTPSPDVPVKEVESLTDLLKRVDTLEPGLVSIKDAALLKQNFPFRKFRAEFNRDLNEYLMKGKFLEEKIARLIKTAADEFRLLDEADPLVYKTIAAEIEALRKNDNVLMENVYTKLEEALAEGLRKGGDTNAANTASQIMSKVKELDALNPNAQSYWQYLMENTYLGKITDFPRNPKTNKIEWFTYFKNVFFRTVSAIFTAQLRTLPELYKEFMRGKKSVPAKFGYIWLYFTGLTKIFVPAVLGVFTTLWNGLKMGSPTEEKEGAFWEQYKGVMEESLKESFIAFNEGVNEEAIGILELYHNREEIDKLGTVRKILNPFETYADDFLDAMNSISGGYTTQKIKEVIDKLIRKFKGDIEERTEVVLDTAETAVDSLQNRVERARPELDSILNQPIRIDTTNLGRSRRRPDPTQ